MSNDPPTGGQTKTIKARAKKKENHNNDRDYNKSNNRYGGNLKKASSSDTLSQNI